LTTLNYLASKIIEVVYNLSMRDEDDFDEVELPRESDAGGPDMPRSSGGFLSRAQRNQAAFLHAVTKHRCHCNDDNCSDCTTSEWTGRLLAADQPTSRLADHNETRRRSPRDEAYEREISEYY
jgi:hypothetical protein